MKAVLKSYNKIGIVRLELIMISKWSAENLINFENKVVDLFNSGQIKAPVHLSSGNEKELTSMFENISESDWVLGSWRSHYHCLLKGIPPEKVLGEIVAGRSISLNFLDYRFFSSAIVGGQVPIAIGIAQAEKRLNSSNHVWCFMGDMTSETGVVQTSIRFAELHELPITFIIEDNGLSVLTNTREVWATETLRYEESKSSKVISYKYTNAYPHAGAGVRIQF